MPTSNYDYMSTQSIKRLKNLVDQCDKHSIKIATTAMGFIKGAFYTNQISDEEQARRMDQVNALVTKFIT